MAKRQIINPMSLFTYFKESRDELKKVTWPSRELTIRYTIIVATASIAVGLITGGFDYLLSLVIERII